MKNMVTRLSDFRIAKLLAEEAIVTQTGTFATIDCTSPTN